MAAWRGLLERADSISSRMECCRSPINSCRLDVFHLRRDEAFVSPVHSVWVAERRPGADSGLRAPQAHVLHAAFQSVPGRAGESVGESVRSEFPEPIDAPEGEPQSARNELVVRGVRLQVPGVL